jgi:hypothetical protein
MLLNPERQDLLFRRYDLMTKNPITLAQLCMMFAGANAKLYCVGRSDFEFDWHADFVFALPSRVKDVGFVHCTEQPDHGDCGFYLGFAVEDKDEEFFMLRGSNNEVVAKLCDIFVQFGKAIRAHNFKRFDGTEQAMCECVSDSFLYASEDVSTGDALTEFVWKHGGQEQILARFDRTVGVPFDCYEQRKYDDVGQIYSWGAKDDEMSNMRKHEAPLSEIFVRYLDPDGEADPIEIPLRVDQTDLPAHLFDYALLLGLSEPKEDEAKEA